MTNNDGKAWYDKVIEIDPKNTDAWNGKGVALYNLRKHNEAIECYDRGVKIDPNYVLGWINKGNVLAKLGRQKDANRYFAKARELGFRETTSEQESSDLEKQQQRRKSMFRIFRK